MADRIRKSRGFTLIELLVVIVLIAVLMGVVFSLSGLGGESAARARTAAKMQKLQNCLSGYFSAFGSYPPVKLQGSQNIYVRVSEQDGLDNVQITDSNGDYQVDSNKSLKWNQVEAACRAQPIAANFPFPKSADAYVRAVSDAVKEKHNGDKDVFPAFVNRKAYAYGFDAIGENPGRFNNVKKYSDWGRIKLFRFGLMSYLLPRYQFMMGGHESFYKGEYQQWETQNELPKNPFTGDDTWSDWADMRSKAEDNIGSGFGNLSTKDILLKIPSQQVCARWIANLQGVVSVGSPDLSPHRFFGVNVSDNEYSIMHADNPGIPLYKANNQQYALDTMTVVDGWGNEFYYYSAAPFQSYQLWSAGPNGKTFPPWLSLDTLTTDQAKTAGEWMADDMIGLSN